MTAVLIALTIMVVGGMSAVYLVWETVQCSLHFDECREAAEELNRPSTYVTAFLLWPFFLASDWYITRKLSRNEGLE